METAIERAISAAGGLTELARRIGGDIKPQHVNNWRHRGVPPDRVLAVEKASGISRHELRPDIFGAQPAPAEARPA